MASALTVQFCAVASFWPPLLATSAESCTWYSLSGVALASISTRGLSDSTQRLLTNLSPSLACSNLPQSCERAKGCVNIRATAGEPSSKRALQSASEKAVALPTSARLLLEASPSVLGPQPVSKSSDDKMATVAWVNVVRAFMGDLRGCE